MTKPNIYLPEKDYFINDVFDYINSTVKTSVINKLGFILRKENHYLSIEKKKQYYFEIAENLSQKIDFNLFEFGFLYNVNFEKNICFIMESTLVNIIQWSPNINDNPNQIAIVGNDLIDTCYVTRDFKEVVIEGYEDFIKKFIEVKGSEYEGLIRQLIDYIVFDYLINLSKNLDQKSNINSNSVVTRKGKTNILNGKPLNLYERFLIANEVVQLENKIRRLKISEAEKHNLLSLILGCNIDNAKKIMNGNYDAKVKENLLADYYETLKL